MDGIITTELAKWVVPYLHYIQCTLELRAHDATHFDRQARHNTRYSLMPADYSLNPLGLDHVNVYFKDDAIETYFYGRYPYPREIGDSVWGLFEKLFRPLRVTLYGYGFSASFGTSSWEMSRPLANGDAEVAKLVYNEDCRYSAYWRLVPGLYKPPPT